jgi:hypothetical protein
MVSSTFEDFKEHREALISAINGQGLHAIAMEHDSALPTGTVIDSSLQKVHDGAAYVGIIGARYGNIPDSAEYNPEGLSLTELEFREARDLGRPILLFIMGPDHDVKQRDVEQDPEKKHKLEAFREEAKRSSVGSRVHRVYKVFNSLSEFEVAATQSVAELRRFLDAQATPADWPLAGAASEPAAGDGIPASPTLYAEPRYIGSHAFVGRTAQLATLNDWAAPAEAHPVLLVEAIGGTGKSMLTWEWTTRHATETRNDWAGLFWYSFYEKGAVMADFCRRALAYMTGQPLAAFEKKKQPELSELLAHQLQSRCWLLILDGLERVLVAYHRYDAAQLVDEQAGRTDEIARRDPCNAIRPLDDDLLRQLAAASPSKILITSRLVPRVLLNAANQPIPGVLYERLSGLRPADAEALLRTCGVHGDSAQMQDYLQRHCDCHPLVTGVVAGLINDYLPDRGHFDAWAGDPDHGGQLNLAQLDLIQKRNHILTAALEALPDASRRLLSTLSLLPESFDYAIIAALNPHRPPEPDAVPEPGPEDDWIWGELPEEQQEQARRGHAAALEQRREYERAYAAWQTAPETLEAAAALTATVRDLEQRGLLQYERQTGRWDLHPVVRAVASSRLHDDDRDHLGQQIIDYFSQRPHSPIEQAKTIEDLHDALTIVRTLFQMGRVEEAWYELETDLMKGLLVNMEAYPESLSLLRPFFPHDWSEPPEDPDDDNLGLLANFASFAFNGLGDFMQAAELSQVAIRTYVAAHNWREVRINLSALSVDFSSLNRLALSVRCSTLALRLAEALGSPAHLFAARLNQFGALALVGRWDEAEAMWNLLDPMGRDWPRNIYRPGAAERSRLELLLLPLGRFTEEDLEAAEDLARTGQNRASIRLLHRLRGEWRYSRGEHALAAESFQDAIRMAHEAGFPDPTSETLLALARFRLNQLPAAREEALRLSASRDPAHLLLAELWHALGDTERAAVHVKAAYRRAWADGEPYVRRYSLDRAKTLLQQLGEDIPALPTYDPAQHPINPWEDEIAAAITELRKSAQSNT